MKLTLEQIRALVEDRYIDRGRAYLVAGQLQLTKVTDDQVSAKCGGTRLYNVMLNRDGKKLRGDCTCPAVDEFGPCKHIAAVALAVMAQSYEPNAAFIERQQHVSRIEKKLLRMSKADLAALVLKLVPDDEELEYILEEDDE
ncbi:MULTISPECIES: SWIM zinc finger domain-containing protein [Asticcacaulis]|uniref:SWIM zinc finger family protein n=1 Tax=Asticcacaulis TaxID=76890 RepID=UPI001AE809BE|nr:MULTISPECIES: SWIM zinc finger family protein [Asticcacaulis]MBP2159710.1 putative Zn finger protein [Asticcacaulis solisilvae]MDR6800463.1 putative Zn finger protein [Asticcacaulis sp. BE141]